MKKSIVILFIYVVMMSVSCKKQDSSVVPKLTPIPTGIDVSVNSNGIVELPSNMPDVFKKVFTKYTKVMAPNGKPIHILIQNGWSDAQAVKGRKVLEHYLTNFPGSEYGNDKSAVANSIANLGGVLFFANDWNSMETPQMQAAMNALGGKVQNQHANEITVEGSEDYLNHKTRDASWEEIFHFVHDYGIKKVLPEYQKEIVAAEKAAAARGFKGWPKNEPSNFPNEYYICVYDNYLNLWKVKPKIYEGKSLTPEEVPAGKSHFGAYPFADSREGVRSNDALGYAMVEKFLPPYITFTPELPSSFNDVFWIRENADKVYTSKSMFLKNVTLTGNNNSGIMGNELDNIFKGNSGNNTFDGYTGDDIVVFIGPRSEYVITKSQGSTTVQDTHSGRDGVDVLTNIEKVKFSDTTISL
ncbi:hypothetical protein K4L44_04855 [Halosquirtibacter laminarini]|uniref:Uncharacterized protein n=1 Tax=Halosquirtibacter laminarini TaxID=3374600 RepID=A0AC61NKJ0_9BACT|nr:hypothetical protein K4L44_04855 [Prolixibacteraceae bacterium]